MEQVDADDPRLRALFWQHRDAVVIQAVHRARLVRETGRKVVVLFARPIPGLKPTSIIREKAAKPAKPNDTLDRLVVEAAKLIDEVGAFSLPMLEEASGSTWKTVSKYWDQVTVGLGLNWFNIPAIQTLNNGAKVEKSLRIALPAKTVEDARLHVTSGRYKNIFIGIGSHVQRCIPTSWALNIPAVEDIPMSAPGLVSIATELETIPTLTPVDIDPAILIELDKLLCSIVDNDGYGPLDTLQRIILLSKTSRLYDFAPVQARTGTDWVGWGRKDWQLDGGTALLRLVRSCSIATANIV